MTAPHVHLGKFRQPRQLLITCLGCHTGLWKIWREMDRMHGLACGYVDGWSVVPNGHAPSSLCTDVPGSNGQCHLHLRDHKPAPSPGGVDVEHIHTANADGLQDRVDHNVNHIVYFLTNP